MKSLLCACLAVALFAGYAPTAISAEPTTLVTGTISTNFLRIRRGTTVKVVEATADGSRIDLVGPNETIQFFFDPVTKSWPRAIERVVEHPLNGNVRGGFTHGQVNFKDNVASFSGHGFIPVNQFNFTVH